MRYMQRPWAQDGAGTGPSGPRPRHGPLPRAQPGRFGPPDPPVNETAAAEPPDVRSAVPQGPFHLLPAHADRAAVQADPRCIPGPRPAPDGANAPSHIVLSAWPAPARPACLRPERRRRAGSPGPRPRPRTARRPAASIARRRDSTAIPNARPSRMSPSASACIYSRRQAGGTCGARAAAPPARTSARSAEAEAYRPGAASSGASWAAPRRGSAKGHKCAVLAQQGLAVFHAQDVIGRAQHRACSRTQRFRRRRAGGGERQARVQLPAQRCWKVRAFQQRCGLGDILQPPCLCAEAQSIHTAQRTQQRHTRRCKALGGQRSVGCRQAEHQVRPGGQRSPVRTGRETAPQYRAAPRPGCTRTPPPQSRVFQLRYLPACPLWKGLYSAMIPAVLMAASLLSAAVHA